MSLLHPIHHTFAPLADRSQVLGALALLFRPYTWRRGKNVERLRSAIAHDINGDVSMFASGREGLLALLRAMQIGPGDEVIIQAYTCVVVPNAIQAAGAVPVYADIQSDTLNIEPESIEALITPRTKAIICQHTFGIPPALSELASISKRTGIPLIEDCAHVIPDADGPSGVARTGEYVIISFGRDKAVSGVSGGAVVSRNPATSARLREEEAQARDLPLIGIKRYLLYPLLYAVARPVYGMGIGKVFLWFCAKLTLLPSIVTPQEKRGCQSPVIHRLPNALAALTLDQWQKRSTINAHRRMLVRTYVTELTARGVPLIEGACIGLPLQKFPLFIANAEAVRQRLKKQNIHLHDGWTGCVVCPANVDRSATHYKDGSDPKAEEACMQILSLPTHPGTTMDDAMRLVDLISTHA